MSRCLLFLLSALVVSTMSVGCCGPRCGVSSCNDCDGIGYGQQVIPQRPLAALRNGSLFCGSGCGEVYVDEWLSNPPKSDPCSGADWVGGSSCGGSSCGGCCWQPGDLFRRFSVGLLGGRHCTGAQSSADCGCGDVGCGGGRLLGNGLLGSSLLGGRNCGCGGAASGCGDGSCGGSISEFAPAGAYAPATSSSCGCSSASASPVGTYVTQTASQFAPPKRDGLTKHY